MVKGERLTLTRAQILCFRRRSGALDERLPRGRRSLRRAAWAGLQDSAPRAASLSIHARMATSEPDTWEDPALEQVWGPRFNVYVVPHRDHAVFTLGLLPEDAAGRRRAEELAARVRTFLGDASMPYDEAGAALGVHPYRLRYAAATGSVTIRWDGARCPTVRAVTPPDADPWGARLELARRFLHVYGPSAPGAFARWSGIGEPDAARAFGALGSALTPVRTPAGDAWLLAADEEGARAPVVGAAPARLLPSGDPYVLLFGPERHLLAPDRVRREALWPPRVWPGAVLVDGEIAGTWRRAGREVTVRPWRRLTSRALDAVAAEVASLPLPGAQVEPTMRLDG